jgi:hypothetical protein
MINKNILYEIKTNYNFNVVGYIQDTIYKNNRLIVRVADTKWNTIHEIIIDNILTVRECNPDIKTKGNQLFNIPNTDEGKNFLRLLNKFKNGDVYYKRMARGSRKNGGKQNFCLVKNADWFAVYQYNSKNR